MVGGIGEWRSLAVGGMAELFVATTDDGREVVVKRLLPHLASHADFRRALVAEGQRMRAVGVGVPAVFDVVEGDEPMIIMEMIPGSTLEQLGIEGFGRAGAVEVILGLLDVLDSVHSAKTPDGVPMQLVHRDVCPANVMRTGTGQVVLLDFGVATAHWPSTAAAGQGIQGRVAYMAPEQARGESVSAASDVFSAGVMLYELVAHRRYYDNTSRLAVIGNILDGHWPDITTVVPDCAGSLASAIRRATTPGPAERFPTAAEFAAAIRGG